VNATDQPDDGEQRDDEPSVADYQRADADRMPTHPAGQQAAVEGMLAARAHADRPRPSVDDLLGRARLDHTRDVPAEPPHDGDTIPRNSARPGPTLDGFRRYLLDTADGAGFVQGGFLEVVVRLLDSYTEANPGAPVPGRDTLSRRNLQIVAGSYRATQRHPDGDLDRLLDDYAAEFSLADIRTLRVAGEAVVAATPRAIKAARDRGMKPPAIAEELALTPSRVYQVLRELDAQQPPADCDQ
jgi:hypothetical protein